MEIYLFKGKEEGIGDIIQQTAVAFDFIQKLYFEVSYMIKKLRVYLVKKKKNLLPASLQDMG